MSTKRRRVIDIQEIRDFLTTCDENTRVYIGCDSERYRKDGIWYADYILAVVVHINGCNGCRLFGEVITERDYDQRRDKPTTRLMKEAMHVASLYLRLNAAGITDDYEVEVHLDLNPKVDQVSNHVVQQAIGYIRGTCNVIPLIKPVAFAASYAADRYKGLPSTQSALDKEAKEAIG